jgi:hypothetical protein
VIFYQNMPNLHNRYKSAERKISQKNRKYMLNHSYCNQTLVEWSLDGPLPQLCPVILTSNQDGRQAKSVDIYYFFQVKKYVMILKKLSTVRKKWKTIKFVYHVVKNMNNDTHRFSVTLAAKNWILSHKKIISTK